MTITVYDQLEQGTAEWLQARAGVITASTVGKFFTPTGALSQNRAKNGLSATGLEQVERLGLERATGIIETTPSTWAMRRGTFLEPFARDEYSMLTAPVTEVGFITRTLDTGATVGYSPDGLVGESGLIEIKCLGATRHGSIILTNTPPAEYVPQLQFGLFVTGREWIDFVSFRPEYVTWTIRVTPDPVWQAAFTEHVQDLDDLIGTVATGYQEATSGLTPSPAIDLDF